MATQPRKLVGLSAETRAIVLRRMEIALARGNHDEATQILAEAFETAAEDFDPYCSPADIGIDLFVVGKLAKLGIVTCVDLTEVSKDELAAQHQFGEKTMAQIETCMTRVGLSFRRKSL